MSSITALNPNKMSSYINSSKHLQTSLTPASQKIQADQNNATITPQTKTQIETQTEARIATAQRTAEQLIATTLIKPILAQVRASNNAPPPFGQTQAEKQFGSLLDNRIADDIAKASNFPIAQRIAGQMLRNSIALPDTQPIDPTFTHSPVDIFG